MKQFIAGLILAASLGIPAEIPNPSAQLERHLREPNQPGDVYSQARNSDHFDYRSALRLATRDHTGLVALLQHNGRTSLMGAAAEEHAAILVELLRMWGDDSFTVALRSCQPIVVSTAQGLLEYAGATRSRFPSTFAARGVGTDSSYMPGPPRGGA